MMPVVCVNGGVDRKFRYSSKDLRVFSHYNKMDISTVNILKNENILRPFIKRRGKRAGMNNKKIMADYSSAERRIYTVTSNRKPMKSNNRSRCGNNLILIHKELKKYIYPRIIISNCRSIRNKFDEICLTIHRLNADLVVLAETWLTESDSEAYNMEGFTAMHRIRGRKDKKHGGGVSIYLRESYSIISVNYPKNEHLEIVTVLFRSINMQHSIPFVALIAVYSPPLNQYSADNIAYIISEVDRIRSINVDADIAIVGDFNDLMIDQYLKEPQYSQLVKHRTLNDRLVDKCFYSGKIAFNITIDVPIASSDHKLILMSPVTDVKSMPFIETRYSRKKTKSNYRSMWCALSNIDWDGLLDVVEYDDAVKNFHNAVTVCYEKSFPLVKSCVNMNNKSWYNNTIKAAMKNRDKLYRGSDMVQYKKLNSEVKKLIEEAKCKQYQKYCNMIDNKSLSFYDVVKIYKGDSRTVKNMVFPGYDIDSSIEQTQVYYNEILNKHSPLAAQELPAYLPGLPIDPISDQYVYSQLRKVKDNNTTAPDGVPNFILREYAYELTAPITKLINRSLATGYCPVLWKNNYLIMLPKNKSVASPGDLRPIVISSSIIKIMERYVYNLLLPTIIDKIDQRQFGGFPGRSPEDYLVFYLDAVHKNLDAVGNKVISIITDYSKAFDAVDHNNFMCNLLSMGPPPSICKWVASFLQGRVLHMKWNNKETGKLIKCSNGAPQGSVLGGLIFSIVINDVARQWDHRLKYVDDLTVLCVQSVGDDNTHPQSILTSLQEDAENTKMNLNINKCQYLVHCFSRISVPSNLELNGTSLNRTDQVKLIGIIIQSNLKWDAHIDFVLSNVNKKMFLLYRLKNVGMNTSLLLKTYCIYIRPTMEYCSVVWTNSLTKKQIFELERIQKRAVRLVMGRNYTGYKDALVELGIISLEARRKNIFYKYALKFMKNYPDFKPVTRLQTSGIQTRGAYDLCTPRCRTTRYRTSPVPSMIEVINHNQ